MISLFKAAVVESDEPGLVHIGAKQMAASAKNCSWPDLVKLVSYKRSDAMEMNFFSQNKISGRISMDKKSILFFSIPFDDGWKATDNGKPVRTVKANIGFTGIYLEKGEHDIELEFKPKYLALGLTVSLFTLLGYFVLVFWWCFRSKKTNQFIESSNMLIDLAPHK
jgi:cbb3-type cytochrome oxidase subunit 3